ncbi:hypothetical protein SmJEL517_g01489 [Synchytrium microbalum]|uniref:DBF4-type domain-containing protein n=1 Tax=Synchytrium microbalum TaxID=1806994 RepID=A0A507C9N0_9FUNG|nr:uncharacterized protein SmJEL517_g01489 [Synchytrium microbalum]TPX36312.1 hypothetical protein SmJEL517_g01489 [Synchytrium microbalum]
MPNENSGVALKGNKSMAALRPSNRGNEKILGLKPQYALTTNKRTSTNDDGIRPTARQPQKKTVAHEMMNRNSGLFASAAGPSRNSSRPRIANENDSPLAGNAQSRIAKPPLPPAAVAEYSRLRSVPLRTTTTTGNALMDPPAAKPRNSAQIRDAQLKAAAATKMNASKPTNKLIATFNSRQVPLPPLTGERFATQQWEDENRKNDAVTWPTTATAITRTNGRKPSENPGKKIEKPAAINFNNASTAVAARGTRAVTPPVDKSKQPTIVKGYNKIKDDENVNPHPSLRKSAFPPPATVAAALKTALGKNKPVLGNTSKGKSQQIGATKAEKKDIKATLMDDKSFVPAWTEKMRRTVFYFYDLNPAQHRRLQKAVEFHGAKVEKFLCPRVTHVVQAFMEVELMTKSPEIKDGVGYKLPGPKVIELDCNDGLGKRLKQVQPKPIELIEHFKNLGKKVWHISRLVDVIQYLQPVKKRGLDDILKEEFWFGPVTGRDTTQQNFRPFTGEYLVVEDSTKIHRPIIIKEFNMNPADKLPPWPKLYAPNQINRCAFIPPPASWLPTVDEGYLTDSEGHFGVRAKVKWSGERETHYELRKIAKDAAAALGVNAAEKELMDDDEIEEVWKAARTECKLTFEHVKVRKESEDGDSQVIPRKRQHQEVDTTDSRKPVGKAFYHRPGYCENCCDKYDDFIEHVNSKRHRDFAIDESNFSELDECLADVQRPISAKFIDTSSSDTENLAPIVAGSTSDMVYDDSDRETVFSDFSRHQGINNKVYESSEMSIIEDVGIDTDATEEDIPSEEGEEENAMQEGDDDEQEDEDEQEKRSGGDVYIVGQDEEDGEDVVLLQSPPKRLRLEEAPTPVVLETNSRTTGGAVSSSASSTAASDITDIGRKSVSRTIYDSVGGIVNMVGVMLSPILGSKRSR